MNEIKMIKLSNYSEEPIMATLEPWCDEYLIRKQQVICLIDSAPDEDIEIEFYGKDIVISGFSHGVKVMCDGKPLNPFTDQD